MKQLKDMTREELIDAVEYLRLHILKLQVREDRQIKSNASFKGWRTRRNERRTKDA